MTGVAPDMLRITLAGDELRGFTSPGPADHVKVFFPDPATGDLALPEFGAAGPRPPASGRVIARDYTPLAFRPDAAGGPELDIDFVIHGDDGPASFWASRAQAGDPLTFAGPRGSHLPPSDVGHAVIVADDTALPAASRWLDYFGEATPVTGLFNVTHPGTERYLGAATNQALHWFSGADREALVASALRGLTITDDTFLFLAGEATALIPLRRYLRRELGLPATQVEVSGYWKLGEGNHDHHAPVDPSDPDE